VKGLAFRATEQIEKIPVFSLRKKIAFFQRLEIPYTSFPFCLIEMEAKPV
jgi:hypothetical protein